MFVRITDTEGDEAVVNVDHIITLSYYPCHGETPTRRANLFLRDSKHLELAEVEADRLAVLLEARP